jgi:hypothetical protein
MGKKTEERKKFVKMVIEDSASIVYTAKVEGNKAIEAGDEDQLIYQMDVIARTQDMLFKARQLARKPTKQYKIEKIYEFLVQCVNELKENYEKKTGVTMAELENV